MNCTATELYHDPTSISVTSFADVVNTALKGHRSSFGWLEASHGNLAWKVQRGISLCNTTYMKLFLNMI